MPRRGSGVQIPFPAPKFQAPPPPCRACLPSPVTMALGGDPPRDPLAPPSAQAPLARSLIGLSPPRRHSRGLHGNPVLDRILDPRLQRESQEKGSDKNRTGFPPSARMTAGRGKVIPGVVRVFLSPSFFVRHSRGLHGNPVLSCAHFLLPSRWRWGETPPSRPTCPPISPSPLARSLAHRPLPSPPSFSWPPRESSPRPHSGSPPSARITGERQRQEQDWIPAFGENDGGEGKGHSLCRACFSFAVILCPSFSWPPRESSPVMCASSFPRHDGAGGRPPSRPTCPPISPSPPRSLPHRPLPSPPSFSWPPRESSPRPHSGFRPSARMTGERQRQKQDWIPTFGENDGGEGKGHSRCRACFSFAVILCPSFFVRHSRGPHGNPVLDRILDPRLQRE